LYVFTALLPPLTPAPPYPTGRLPEGAEEPPQRAGRQATGEEPAGVRAAGGHKVTIFCRIILLARRCFLGGMKSEPQIETIVMFYTENKNTDIKKQS